MAFAHNAQLVWRLFRGDLVGAEEHFARWTAFREAAGYGQVPGEVVVVLSYASLCAGFRGYAEKARERIVEALALARVTKSPFDLHSLRPATSPSGQRKMYGFTNFPAAVKTSTVSSPMLPTK